MKYSAAFKSKMVRKMTAPQGMTAVALSREIGVHQTTLSRWLRDAGTVAALATQDHDDKHEGLNSPMTAKRPQDWSAEEKLSAVLEAETLSDEDLGAFLRSKGLHETQLRQWRELMLAGLKDPSRPTSGKKPVESRRIRQLEKDLARKDKALAEASALLVLKKKAQEIWGDEDDDTEKRSGK